jgi:hypothetical protein
MLSKGVLYPCQAIFLSPHMQVMPRSFLGDSQQKAANPFLIVEGVGVFVNDEMTVTAIATLTGLAQILQRIDDCASIRYLEKPEVENVMSVDTYRYRELVETNSAAFAS